MAKKDTPAAKSATASGTGAQAAQSSDGVSGAQGDTSTSGHEAELKANTTDTNGSMLTDVGTGVGDDLRAAIASSMAGVNDDLSGLANGVSVPGLLITARYDGFRRAGRAWSSQPTVVRRDEFTPEQLWQLEDEPCLRVQYMEIKTNMDDDK